MCRSAWYFKYFTVCHEIFFKHYLHFLQGMSYLCTIYSTIYFVLNISYSQYLNVTTDAIKESSINSLINSLFSVKSKTSFLASFGIKNLLWARPKFNPWVGKIPWRRKWHPTPVFLAVEFHRQRSLVEYSSWDRKELDMAEWLTLILTSVNGVNGFALII